MKEKLFEVRELTKTFSRPGGKKLHAVDGVSFDIYKGETLGIVGESGCGKTTCGRTVIGLYPKNGGQSLYRGKDVHKMSRQEYFQYTKNVQTVFQDPYTSLNPRMKVVDIIAEGIDIHHMAANAKERRDMVYELLELVGLNREHAERYVHEFSGGQRQRICIARALAVNPEFLLCDEAISALDVSIQAQIVNLLMRLQKQKDLTYMFIAHDLTMVRYISDRVAVMYLGSIVEMGPSDELYTNPLHPYTRVLISAVPIADPEAEAKRQRMIPKGEACTDTPGENCCKFCARCTHATDLCRSTRPELKDRGNGHWVACHLLDQQGG